MPENQNQIPEAPEGVVSDHNPPETQAPAQIRDALKRFDESIERARAAPSRALQALKLAELVIGALPEELRMAHAQLKYETYPKKEGGLGLQVDFRRNPHASMQLHVLRQEAERVLRAKRIALSEAQ